MATENRVNLLEAFESQESNNFILLTTFSFDPIFFDTVIFDDLRRNNPYAEIFILVDSGTYQAKYDDFTARTGTDYHLVPIDVPNGFFHPKVQLFISETDESATILTGSANLTLPGLTQNLETVLKVELDLSERIDPSLLSVIEFFESISTELTNDQEYRSVLDDLADARFMERETSDPDDIRFLSNQQVPILEQVSGGITDTAVDEVVLAAPFISNSPGVVADLIEAFAIDRVTVILQAGNHNLESVDAYRSLAATHDIEFQLRKLVSSDNRYLHAKLLALYGDTTYLLVGSANMTAAALQNSWSAGNVEGCFILRDPSHNLLEELAHEPVSDEAEFVSNSTPEFRDSGQNHLSIYTARYIDAEERLVLQTEVQAGTGELTVRTRDPTATTTTEIDLSNAEHAFLIKEGIPTEVLIQSGEHSGRRRVFYDEDQIFKQVRRTSNSLQELSDSFDERGGMGLSDLMFLFRSLNEEVSHAGATATESDSTGGDSSTKGPHRGEEFQPPSRGSGSTSGLDPLLRKLTQAYEAVRSEQQQRQELGEVQTLDEMDATAVHTDRISDNRDEFDKRIRKIIREATKLLSRYAETSDNQAEAWLEGQHLLLRFFLVLIGPVTVSEDVFETLESQLDENLESFEYLHQTSVDFDAKIKRRFFTYLLTYNLLNRSAGRDEYRPAIGDHWLLRHLYTYDELLTSETYHVVKDQTRSMIETHLNEVVFDIEAFRETYASLAAGSIGTTAHIQPICREMFEEDDAEFRQLQQSVLYVLSEKFFISRRVKQQLRKLDVPEDPDSAAVIDELLQQ